MGTIIDFAKQEILSAMYRSVERMNIAIASGDEDAYNLEVDLQKNLRKSFEKVLRN